MFKITLLLDSNRARNIETNLNISAIQHRTYMKVFSQTIKSGLSEMSKVISDVIFDYEMTRMKGRMGNDLRFSFGDKIQIEDLITGQKREIYHCMAGNGYVMM